MGQNPTVNDEETAPPKNGSSAEIYLVAWSEFRFSSARPSPSVRHTGTRNIPPTVLATNAFAVARSFRPRSLPPRGLKHRATFRRRNQRGKHPMTPAAFLWSNGLPC
jgi:hypothetical protein